MQKELPWDFVLTLALFLCGDFLCCQPAVTQTATRPGLLELMNLCRETGGLTWMHAVSTLGFAVVILPGLWDFSPWGDGACLPGVSVVLIPETELLWIDLSRRFPKWTRFYSKHTHATPRSGSSRCALSISPPPLPHLSLVCISGLAQLQP